jgi:hypothetical protein
MTDAMAASMVEGGGIADTIIGGGTGIATIVVGIAIAGITTVTIVDMTGAIIGASGKQTKCGAGYKTCPTFTLVSIHSPSFLSSSPQYAYEKSFGPLPVRISSRPEGGRQHG